MRFFNPAVLHDLEAGRGLRLNLGCGNHRRPGFYGLDHLDLPAADIVADLNQPLDLLPDNSVDEIYTRHTLEHVTEFLPLMQELHRVTRPGGRIEISVPHFSNPYGYSDPTHVRFFGLYSFFYFSDECDQPRRKVPSFYIPERFIVESVRIQPLRQSHLGRPFGSVLKRCINGSLARLDWYERRLCRWLPADSIYFVLRPKKPAHEKWRASQADSSETGQVAVA
jgi:SAM-dependent methyltransferase